MSTDAPVPGICAACGLGPGGRPCAQCGQEPLLRQRYSLELIVGQGGSGTTHRATDLQTSTVVAIKEMPLHRAESSKASELLAREVDVLRQLDHPAIPDYVDHFLEGKGKHRSYYLVRQFIEGHTLAEEMRDHRYDVGEVLDIAEEVLGILTYLHGLSPPVVHRDIKPGNLMRRPTGSLVLLDFGSVRDVLRDVELGGSTVAGTFGYMAPEQFGGDASPRSDLYGVGATLVALLSRKDPSTMQRANTIALDWRPHVAVPAGPRAFLDKLLAADPADRFDSAESALRGLAVARRPPAAHEQPSTAESSTDPFIRSQVMDRATMPSMGGSPELPARRPGAPAMIVPRPRASAWILGAGLAFTAAMILLVNSKPAAHSGRTSQADPSWVIAATAVAVNPGGDLSPTWPQSGERCTVRGTADGPGLPHRLHVDCTNLTVTEEVSCRPSNGTPSKGFTCDHGSRTVLMLDRYERTIVVSPSNGPENRVLLLRY